MKEEKAMNRPKVKRHCLGYMRKEDIVERNVFPSIEEIEEIYGSAIAKVIKESSILGEYRVPRSDLMIRFVRTRGKVREQDILSEYPESIHDDILQDLSHLRRRGELACEIEGGKRFYYFP